MQEIKNARRDEIILGTDEKVALCRCWQSKKFPYCDGSHRELDLHKGPVTVSNKVK